MNVSRVEYNKSSYFYDEIMNSFAMDFSLYEDLIEILKPNSVLELGCGMGRLFPIFMKEAKDIVGVDISDDMVSKGREYYQSLNNENMAIEFIQSDMCSFRKDKKYDLIVLALSVLKHLTSDAERLEAIENAKNHLSEDGFIVIDHSPFLYASRPTEWVNARQSLVADWLPDPNVLDGYQWKKSIEGEKDILQWRYDSEQTPFEAKFTTYIYDIDKLTGHLSQLGLKYEHILTEWGINGLNNRGKRFIGLVTHPNNTYNPKSAVIESIKRRNQKLWSDFDIYLEDIATANKN